MIFRNIYVIGTIDRILINKANFNSILNFRIYTIFSEQNAVSNSKNLISLLKTIILLRRIKMETIEQLEKVF